MTVNSSDFAFTVTQDHVKIPTQLLKAGTNSIVIHFSAGAGGLHRRENFVYTLFVPDNASKTLPCFDQPDLKAIYKLTLKIPKDWKAVSQGTQTSSKQDGDTTTIAFSETKPTSTYLFAFAAGKFKTLEREVDGRPMTMFHLETDQKKIDDNANALFEMHGKALHWLENYTGIPYPFEKFDFVLLPAFPFGGMEHPGSIFYNDKSLLLDESATQTQLLSRANVIAHETSHSWFGDLVTMTWFNDVWLKEVFANFMADKIVAPLFPKINHDVRFLLAHYPAAYRVDRTAGTNPISQNLENLRFASSLYGDIIYNKAPIAMRQLEKYIGETQFHLGLKEYLKAFEFKNATWSQLIAILSKHTKKSLTKWNHDWIKNAGRPVFKVKLNDKEILVGETDPTGHNLVWPQTLNLTIGTNGKNLELPIEMKNGSAKTKIPVSQNKIDYLLSEAVDPGYGLFPLDPSTLDFFSSHFSELENENTRAVAWVDIIQNIMMGAIPPRYLIDLAIKALPHETNEQIIDMTLGSLGYMYWALLSDGERGKVSVEVENMLWDRVNSKDVTKFARTSFFRSYQSLLRSEAGWHRLYDIWSGKQQIKDVNFSESDFMGMAYQLALRNSLSSEITQKQSERIKDPERKQEFLFVIQAAGDSQEGRDALFNKIITDDNVRKNEPWIRDALGFLHHPLHGSGSEKYVGESLEILPKIKQTGGIFFPLDWLYGTLGYHVSQNTRKIVENYLKTHPDLEKGLRLKILQAADPLMRLTKP